MLIVLIGNYEPDKQESMERFIQMLDKGFRTEGYRTEIWRPLIFFSKPFRSTISGIGKWFGYLDKWILFPIVIRYRLRKKRLRTNLRFHVCDHSNSPYLKHLPKDITSITCHDVLAIRGAFGYNDAYCPASTMGKILQKWILSNLAKAKSLAAVSHHTLMQLKELAGNNRGNHAGWQVIHNGFNANFHVIKKHEQNEILKRAGIEEVEPFILHVGSSLPRKNRGLLLEMISILGDRWNGNIYFAGDQADRELTEQIKKLSLTHRVRFIIKPGHETLLALYNACDVFIFPSFSEGFGWPLIEAQACGAPVIASNVEPMPEVSGGAAMHARPESATEFASAYLKLHDRAFRTQLIEEGFQNARRYDQADMIKKYLKLHGLTKQPEYVS